MFRLNAIFGKLAWLMFWRSFGVWLPTLVGILANLTVWLLPPWQLNLNGRSYIALHYSIYVGTTRLAPWYHIYLMPASGLLVLVIHNLLAYLLPGRYQLLKKILLWSAAGINCLLIWVIYLLIVFNS